MSKLAYLSKYIADNHDDEEEGDYRTKKKKKKSKKHKKESCALLVDDEDLIPSFEFKKESQANSQFDIDNDDDEEEEEEGPVVVKSEELGALVDEKQVDRSSNRPSRKRYDSSDDEKPSLEHRRRYDSSSDDDSVAKERMSSGHRAGLQEGTHFSHQERKIQQQRHAEAQAMVDKYGMGETVYRDKDGKIVSGAPVPKTNRKRPLTDQEQAEINQGRAQKLMKEQQQQEFSALQQASFARYADDERLEALRRQEIREGDPMAATTRNKKQSHKPTRSEQNQPPLRPIYKGPAPKPNRYGIRPGYRWDGNNRGNGFEDRLLVKRFSAQERQEQAYRYSAADM